MRESPTILKVDKDHCCAIWRNIVITIWREVTRPAIVDEHRKYIEGHIAKHRVPLSFFVVTEQKSEMPDSATREKLAGFLQAAAPVGCGAALVFEGGGFRGAAVRGVTTVLNTLARQPYPYRSFGTVESGATWLGSIHVVDGKPGAVSSADLIATVATVRAA